MACASSRALGSNVLTMRTGFRMTISRAYFLPISALNRYVTHVSCNPSTLSGKEPSSMTSKGNS